MPDSSESLGLRVAGTAIVGSRSQQQDRYGYSRIEDDDAWLLVLADGMGGHEGGAIASRIVVDGFTAAFHLGRKQKNSLGGCFESALNSANALLADAQKDNPPLAGMGTTLVAAYVSSAGLTWISVGDSPMWLLRGGQMLRLNDDHSLRALVGASGANANMLQSALNGAPIPLIDSQLEPVPLEPGDVLILASDGLLTLDEATIAKAASRHYPSSDTIVQSLVDAVEKRHKSNQDNCTVVVAIGQPLPGGLPRSAKGRWPLSRFWT